MSYLTTADYAGRLPDYIRDDVESGIAEVRTQAESDAQSMISDYIGSRYDIVAVFAQTGSNRSASIVRCMTALSIYFMHQATSPDQIPETIMQAYEREVQFLSDVSRQIANPDLPSKPDLTQEEVRYGSQKRRRNHLSY